MHGRTLALALVLLSLTIPATASADPMPDGTYNVTFTGGNVKIGAGLLPSISFAGTGTFPVTLAGQSVPLSVPPVTIPQTAFSTPIPFGTLNGTLDVTVASLTGSIDPATGNATADLAFYGTASATGNPFGIAASASCTLGNAAQPVTLHLTTASGTPWSATTGKFAVADKTFTVPPLNCGGSSLEPFINSLILGDTSSGKNDAQMFGDAQRIEGSSGGSGSGGSGTGGGTGTTTPTTPTTTQSLGTTPTTRVAPRTCTVPKLKGKRLGTAKRAITRAGCKVGKVKSKKSKRKKKGTVLSQGRRAGAKVPLGTRVALTVAKRGSR